MKTTSFSIDQQPQLTKINHQVEMKNLYSEWKSSGFPTTEPPHYIINKVFHSYNHSGGFAQIRLNDCPIYVLGNYRVRLGRLGELLFPGRFPPFCGLP